MCVCVCVLVCSRGDENKMIGNNVASNHSFIIIIPWTRVIYSCRNRKPQSDRRILYPCPPVALQQFDNNIRYKYQVSNSTAQSSTKESRFGVCFLFLIKLCRLFFSLSKMTLIEIRKKFPKIPLILAAPVAKLKRINKYYNLWTTDVKRKQTKKEFMYLLNRLIGLTQTRIWDFGCILIC